MQKIFWKCNKWRFCIVIVSEGKWKGGIVTVNIRQVHLQQEIMFWQRQMINHIIYLYFQKNLFILAAKKQMETKADGMHLF